MMKIFHKKEKPEIIIGIVRPLLISLTTVLAILFAGLPTAIAQDIRVQDDGDVQVFEDGQDVVIYDEEQYQDLQSLEPEEITFIDVSNIPDSVPIPEGDWVFEVPLDLRELPPEVERVGVLCRVFHFVTQTRAGGRQVTITRASGRAKHRVDVADGSVQETVFLGIKGLWDSCTDGHNCPWNAKKWECEMYLIGEDHHWNKPTKKVRHPYWRRADPEEPFRWHTGAKSLPAEARFAKP